MCGRYTNTISIKKLAERFGFNTLGDDFRPRYNIAPGQMAPVVLRRSPNQLQMMRWGLVPFWAKEEKIGYKMINARGETVDSKPSFRGPFRKRRCLVLADGFYEWQAVPGAKKKIPMRIVLKDRAPFGFAGLWDEWNSSEGQKLHTFTIITTEANAKLKKIHDRMPVILRPEDEPVWLDTDLKDLKKLKALIKPYPEKEMSYYPVGTLVNSPKNDVPECLEEAHG
ncbi:MAG: SOS response-associated peptidase [bacterium]|nr:SOS response-associated peptidase [bacterium]